MSIVLSILCFVLFCLLISTKSACKETIDTMKQNLETEKKRYLKEKIEKSVLPYGRTFQQTSHWLWKETVC